MEELTITIDGQNYDISLSREEGIRIFSVNGVATPDLENELLTKIIEHVNKK